MYEKECRFFMDTAKAALKKYLGIQKETIQKSEFDLVTAVDTSVEKFVVDAILEEYPKDTIISEEYNPTAEFGKRTWVIDPIDGTCNFAKGIPLFGFQGVLCVDAKPVVAIMILPGLHEEYYAIKGQGAYKNGKRIEITGCENMNNAFISFGDIPHDRPIEEQEQYRLLPYLYPSIGRVKYYGAACVDFSFVACGRTDGTVLFAQNPWDVLPGYLLCKEAGAVISDTEGKKYQIQKDGIVVASSKELHQKLIQSIVKGKECVSCR